MRVTRASALTIAHVSLPPCSQQTQARLLGACRHLSVIVRRVPSRAHTLGCWSRPRILHRSAGIHSWLLLSAPSLSSRLAVRRSALRRFGRNRGARSRAGAIGRTGPVAQEPSGQLESPQALFVRERGRTAPRDTAPQAARIGEATPSRCWRRSRPVQGPLSVKGGGTGKGGSAGSQATRQHCQWRTLAHWALAAPPVAPRQRRLHRRHHRRPIPWHEPRCTTVARRTSLLPAQVCTAAKTDCTVA